MRSTLLLLAGTFAALYFGTAAYLCHFEIEQRLFPTVAWAGVHDEQSSHRLARPRKATRCWCGNTVSRALAASSSFPDNMAGVARYRKDLFSAYAANGLAVFALSYPGQDGAPGRTKLDEIQFLSKKALELVGESCPLPRTVLVGRSLGSMLAAYATQGIRPVGLVLEAAAPSLSSAIRVRLRSHWYLSPLAHLSVSKLLPHDYSLAEALTDHPKLPGRRVSGYGRRADPDRLAASSQGDSSGSAPCSSPRRHSLGYVSPGAQRLRRGRASHDSPQQQHQSHAT